MSTETKAALLIGIMYRGTRSALNGCINDVTAMREYLINTRGYEPHSITVITDDTPIKPTRQVIINELLKLLQSGATQLFLHYSGHGSHTIDYNSDEDDRQDECLVPLDYQRAGMITDDQIAGLLAFLKPESRMTVVLDCCHSGTGFDLCYTFTEQPNKGEYVMTLQSVYPNTNGQVVMISGCLDSQTSADAFINKKYQGALTYSLLKVLADTPDCTYLDLLLHTRALLKKDGYTQIPHMTSGRNLDLQSKINF